MYKLAYTDITITNLDVENFHREYPQSNSGAVIEKGNGEIRIRLFTAAQMENYLKRDQSLLERFRHAISRRP